MLLGLAALVSSCGGTFDVEVPACETDEGSASCEVFQIVNEERVSRGRLPYEWSHELAVAGQLHAEDMVDRGYFSHQSLDGRSFVDRARDADYDGFPTGENIAAGQTSATQVMQSWMNSSGHRSNILSEGSTEIGIGFYENYWVQVFGSR